MKGKTIIGTDASVDTARDTAPEKKQVCRTSTAGRKFGPRRPIPGAPAHIGESRCTRAQATDRLWLARQVPAGRQFATSYHEYFEALEYAMDEALFQDRRRETTRVVVRDMFRNQHYDADGRPLFTCSTSWKKVKERLSISRSAYYDAWCWLVKEAKLVLWVAWAREEEWKPSHLQGKEGEEGNDRGVYGFIIPRPTAGEKRPANLAEGEAPVDNQPEVPVDKKETVTGIHAGVKTPQRARGSVQAPASQRNKAFASLRRLSKGGSAALRHLLLDRKDPLPSRGETAKRLGSASPSRKSQALFAASVIAELPNPLSKLSPQHLASILRGLHIFDADWTVNDVLHALSYRPPGEGEWRRSDSVRHVGGWVQFRLGAWSGPDGRPVNPKSKIDAEYQARAAEEARIAAAQLALDNEFRARQAAELAAGIVSEERQRVREMLSAHRQAKALRGCK